MCLLRGTNWVFNLLKPTGYAMHQQCTNSRIVCSAYTVFMCFVFIWEQTATCATSIINWLVFITELKSVYCAVRTGSLSIIQIRFSELARSQRASGRFCDRSSRHQFSWFSSVLKQMLRWYSRSQVDTACFSCSLPDWNPPKLIPLF
jgi:hypothetical protein